MLSKPTEKWIPAWHILGGGSWDAADEEAKAPTNLEQTGDGLALGHWYAGWSGHFFFMGKEDQAFNQDSQQPFGLAICQWRGNLILDHLLADTFQ